MNKIIKIARWVFISLIIATIVFMAGVYIYIENSIDLVISKDRQSNLIESINSSPKLPDNFYKTIKKFLPDYFEIGAWDVIVNRV